MTDIRIGGVLPSGSQPPYFNQAGFDAFRQLKTEETDVIAASFAKCGTSWFHQILFSMLRMDAQGQLSAPAETLIGSDSQVYPDGKGEKEEKLFQRLNRRSGQSGRPPTLHLSYSRR